MIDSDFGTTPKGRRAITRIGGWSGDEFNVLITYMIFSVSSPRQLGVKDTNGCTNENTSEGVFRVLESFDGQRCLKRVHLAEMTKVNFESCEHTLALQTCEPQPLRAIVRVIPPRSSCPPCFGFSTACAKRMAPAQVPHIGFVLVYSLSGCKSPARFAKRAIVVDSAERKERVR